MKVSVLAKPRTTVAVLPQREGVATPSACSAGLIVPPRLSHHFMFKRHSGSRRTE